MPTRLVTVVNEYLVEISEEDLADQGGFDVEDLRADAQYFSDALHDYVQEDVDWLSDSELQSQTVEVKEVTEA